MNIPKIISTKLTNYILSLKLNEHEISLGMDEFFPTPDQEFRKFIFNTNLFDRMLHQHGEIKTIRKNNNRLDILLGSRMVLIHTI